MVFENVGIGLNAMYTTTTGYNNVGIGSNVLYVIFDTK